MTLHIRRTQSKVHKLVKLNRLISSRLYSRLRADPFLPEKLQISFIIMISIWYLEFILSLQNYTLWKMPEDKGNGTGAISKNWKLFNYWNCSNILSFSENGKCHQSRKLGNRPIVSTKEDLWNKRMDLNFLTAILGSRRKCISAFTISSSIYFYSKSYSIQLSINYKGEIMTFWACKCSKYFCPTHICQEVTRWYIISYKQIN